MLSVGRAGLLHHVHIQLSSRRNVGGSRSQGHSSRLGQRTATSVMCEAEDATKPAAVLVGCLSLLVTACGDAPSSFPDALEAIAV
jgi:hypothetical protein